MKTDRIFKHVLSVLTVLLTMCITGCQNQIEDVEPVQSSTTPTNLMSRSSDSELPFLQGADLSYINELQDGGVQYTKDGNSIDPYHLIKEYGGNLVRLRLWHNPTWTNYSTLADVKRSISRAKQEGLRGCLITSVNATT